MNGCVDLGGYALNTEIDGPENAPWMILSNSLGATLAMWQPQMDLLTARYRVLRYDTRGHGQSDTPGDDWSFKELTRDVISLMDHYDIATADFMGLSMGGMTGLGLALDHSDRIGSVICADARADAPDPFRAMWDERIANVAANGLHGIVDGTLASWFTPDWLHDNPTLAGEVREMVLGNAPQGYIECCKALKTLDYLQHLRQITCPVLYIGGDQDKGAAPAVMGDMASKTAHGRYVSIPNAAHVSNINQPDAFNAAISAFLDTKGEM